MLHPHEVHDAVLPSPSGAECCIHHALVCFPSTLDILEKAVVQSFNGGIGPLVTAGGLFYKRGFPIPQLVLEKFVVCLGSILLDAIILVEL